MWRLKARLFQQVLTEYLIKLWSISNEVHMVLDIAVKEDRVNDCFPSLKTTNIKFFHGS